MTGMRKQAMRQLLSELARSSEVEETVEAQRAEHPDAGRVRGNLWVDGATAKEGG